MDTAHDFKSLLPCLVSLVFTMIDRCFAVFLTVPCGGFVLFGASSCYLYTSCGGGLG